MKPKKLLQPGTNSQKSKRILFISANILLLAITIIVHLAIDSHSQSTAQTDNKEKSAECPSSMNIIRDKNNGLSHPLYLANVTEESADFGTMKDYLNNIIRQEKEKGNVHSVSVYFRSLNNARWMSIDGDQIYYPGSLMKVPIMIYYMKKEEKSPGYLNRELTCRDYQTPLPSQAFTGATLQNGVKYKISDLLRYMIVESDNKATAVLSDYMDSEEFWKIFSDLSIPPDETHNFDYKISSIEYSKFFRVLYNATYLNEKLSESALKLLSESKFDKGITKMLPSGLTVARKFGEREFDGICSLSEAAIVYFGSDPYLLIIMTSGNDVRKQADLISNLSYDIYKSFVKS